MSDDNNNNNENDKNPKIVSMVEHIKTAAVEAAEGPDLKVPEVWQIFLRNGEVFTLEGFLFIASVYAVVDSKQRAIFSAPYDQVSYCIQVELADG